MVEMEMEIDEEGKVTLKASRADGERPVCVLVQQLISGLGESGGEVTSLSMDECQHGHRHDFKVRGRGRA